MTSSVIRVLPVALAAVWFATAASAGQCEKHYSAVGVPLVTPIVFESWMDFKGLAPDKALKRMARAVKSEGFSGIKVDSGRLIITAYQESTGSGRTQKLTVTAKKTKDGTRARVSFKIKAGQVAADRHVRPGMCKILNAADG
ncbi:hypothetical protein OU426_03065 [Frigidibacter sp. RF13]|uniref:hypothetical protein n=1 Tax=Frigidibacter sp. RF13 TaxID=2997340 RepID=UPI00226EC585|nr:hypothetical protein [Frigidibacter sp. RF13]MCY1125823.1 hypothetical protein [Frigidibacter sp. RF13]